MPNIPLHQIDTLTLTVGPPGSGARYSTLKEALAAAAPYSTVAVYPHNNYPEDNPLVIPPHVSVIYVGLHETGYIDCQNPNAHGIVMSDDTEVQGLQVRNASGAGYSAFHVPAGVADVEWHDCKWRDCDRGFLSETAGFVLCRDAHVSGGTSTDGIACINGGSMFVTGFTVAGTATVTNPYHSDGAGSLLVSNVTRVRGALTTRASLTENGGALEMQVYHASDCAEGHVVEATGGTLSLGACQLTGVAGDHLRLGDDPSVVCIANSCYLDDDKFNIGANATLRGNYESAGSRPGPTVIGELWSGVDPIEQVPLASLTRDTASTGWSSGLAVTDAGGLNVAVAVGWGYVNTGTGVVKVSYAGGSIAVTDDSDFWIFLTSAGVLSQQAAAPSPDASVVLANGRSEGGDIVLLASRIVPLEHVVGDLHEYIAQVIGPIWLSGLVTTLPGLLALDVSSGSYYLVNNVKTATGATPITVTTWYNDGTWKATAGVGNVPNGQYNNFGVGLAAIPAGEWVQHGLYVAVSPSGTQFHLVYAQATYAAQNLAEAAALPTPPGIFDDACMVISGPVVQQGAAAVTSVIDHRPVIQTGTAGTALAPTDHSALANLGVDSHGQYALLGGNAARNPITGIFDFAGGGLTLPISAAPVQIIDGRAVWDSVLKLLTVGDGADRKTLVDTTTAQTLAAKTLTTPTIASMVNANHNHQDAAGGGVLAAPGITSFANGQHDHEDAAGGGTLAGAAVTQATALLRGSIELATQAEVNAGGDTDRAVTPATLAAVPKLANIAPDNHTIETGALDAGVGGAVPTTIAAMTYTPPAGTWLVRFEGSIEGNANAQATTRFYSDATPIGNDRTRNFANNQYGSVSHAVQVTTTGAETITLRLSTSAATVDVHGRSLSFTRVTSI